jgi:IPT/TIG domain
MRPHRFILAAGFIVAGSILPARLALAQGDPGRPSVRDHRDHRRPDGPRAVRYKARWDRTGWVELGRQQVLGRRDRDVIKVGRREGRFDRLMVVVEDSDLEMKSMRIRFASGDVYEPALRHLFRENARTRSIDLPGERRGVVIDQIEFRYANLPGGGRASVSVWGHEDRGGRPPYRGPKPIIIDYWPRHGSVGTEVTIHGRRFGSQLQVLFGNQVITPSRRADNFLTFKVPRHRGDAFVSLRVSGWRDLPVGRFDVSGRNAELERERRAEARRLAAQRWWQARQRQIARNAAAREAALRAEEARLAREREARRKRRIAELRRRWEQRFLVQQDVRVELALHAERNARLERMLRLAEAGDFGPLAIRIRMMVDFEEMRHQQRMDDLKAAYARR